jgi:hypothetical protein
MNERFERFVRFDVVQDGDWFAGDLFRRKFAAAPPATEHHVIAFCRSPDGALATLGYAHFMPFGDIVLVGGVCTDGRVIAAMTDTQRAAIDAAGGVYFNLLGFAFARFAGECEAYFGYCGDARAETVNLRAGFARTEHPHLLVNFHKPQHEVMRRALIAKAAAIGPF